MSQRVMQKQHPQIDLSTMQSGYWDARAIHDCLSYLESEAKQADLHELAHLIGVAAVSAEETTRSLGNPPKPH